MVGDGVRILGMGVATILFAALGFMSSASRGVLVTGMLCFYLVLGLAAGYTAVRLWKTVRHGDSAGWKAVVWRALVLFPGIGFSSSPRSTACSGTTAARGRAVRAVRGADPALVLRVRAADPGRRAPGVCAGASKVVMLAPDMWASLVRKTVKRAKSRRYDEHGNLNSELLNNVVPVDT
ncbi:Transmembrane 9 superfamily member 2 [Hordeum vulgare]|nr:Transmembrane 9 superfamily member 2 [Hordeum vulgare]